jgi:16S rRNA processing protein RimM
MSAPPARYFISELVGCSVFDGPRPIGIVADVEESPAGTLLHIRPLRGEEILVPLAEEYICEVNVAAKKLGLRLPEGLLDINSK